MNGPYNYGVGSRGSFHEPRTTEIFRSFKLGQDRPPKTTLSPDGGIGRRTGLKILGSERDVPVRFWLWASAVAKAMADKVLLVDQVFVRNT